MSPPIYKVKNIYIYIYIYNDWKGGNTWNILPMTWNYKITPSFISVPFPLNKSLQLAETDVYKT